MKMCPGCLVVATAFVGVSAFAFLGGAGAAPTTAASGLAVAATTNAASVFTVDPVHSSVVYKIKHNNVSNFYGRFNKVEGTFNLDAANPSASVLNVTIDANSIDSNNGKRDEHLKSGDFFAVKEFPSITFVGKAFKKAGDNTFEVKGDLTIRGKTNSITVNVEDTGHGTARTGAVAGIAATFKVNRGDYGVSFMLDKGISNEVTLMIGLEGGQAGGQ